MDLLETGFSVVDWIGLAQDRYRWRALVNSEMNLRFHKILGEYRVDAQLVASRVVFSSTDLVSWLVICAESQNRGGSRQILLGNYFGNVRIDRKWINEYSFATALTS
jgi:hypothetical protein